MKKVMLATLSLVMLTVAFSLGSLHGSYQNGAPVIEMAYTPSKVEMPRYTKAEVIRIADPVVDPVPAPTPAPTQSAFSYIASNLLDIFSKVIAVAFAALVSGVLMLLAKKFNIQISQSEHDLITSYAETAATKAEAWAAKQKEVPSGNEKLNYAIGTLKTISKQPIIKNYTDTQLAHYVEEAVYKVLGQNDPNDPTPAAAPTPEGIRPPGV